MPVRMHRAHGYFRPGIGKAILWTVVSREIANYTYDLTEENVSLFGAYGVRDYRCGSFASQSIYANVVHPCRTGHDHKL
jgi:hypothetical protein